MKVNCFTCGTAFEKPSCWVKRTKKNFCSKMCHDTEQSKNKVLKCCEFCNDSYFVSASQQKRFSTCNKEVCRYKKKQKENNGMWKGGKAKERNCSSQTRAYKRWRKAVFERDDYTCVFCSTRGGNLNADHILPYAFFPHLRLSLNNGRTLCIDCHQKTYKESSRYRDGKASIAVKDLRNGVVTYYNGLEECARAFNSKKEDIEIYIQRCSKGKISLKHYLFVYEDETWLGETLSDMNRFQNGIEKPVVVNDPKETRTIIFDTCSSAASHFGYEASLLIFHMLKHGDKPFHGRVFRYIDDPSLKE